MKWKTGVEGPVVFLRVWQTVTDLAEKRRVKARFTQTDATGNGEKGFAANIHSVLTGYKYVRQGDLFKYKNDQYMSKENISLVNIF